MSQEFRLINEDTGFCYGTPDNNDKYQRKLIFRTQPDGTLRAWSPLVIVDQLGRERIGAGENDGSQRMQMVLWETTTPGQIRWRAEDTGEAMVSNLGWDGAAPIRLLTEADGTLRTSFVGTDEAGNEDSQRTDPNRIPWKRDYPAYVQVDPVVLANADGLLWNPGAAAAELYEVSFLLVNIAGAITGAIDVGVDIGAGGALGGAEFWVRQETLPNPGTSGWRGPFIIPGDDDVRGWCAGAGNQVCIHFRIRRVDVGA